MKCPYCGCEDTKVIDSRALEETEAIRRRRECTKCNKRFTTYERIEYMPVLVIKKDGSRQPFDKSKILAGLLKACEKRHIPIEKLKNLADDIEKKVYQSVEREITSKEIGELAMASLLSYDEVAYVRFASVYKDFQDIESFMTELNRLKDKKKTRA